VEGLTCTGRLEDSMGITPWKDLHVLERLTCTGRLEDRMGITPWKDLHVLEDWKTAGEDDDDAQSDRDDCVHCAPRQLCHRHTADTIDHA